MYPITSAAGWPTWVLYWIIGKSVFWDWPPAYLQLIFAPTFYICFIFTDSKYFASYGQRSSFHWWSNRGVFYVFSGWSNITLPDNQICGQVHDGKVDLSKQPEKNSNFRQFAREKFGIFLTQSSSLTWKTMLSCNLVSYFCKNGLEVLNYCVCCFSFASQFHFLSFFLLKLWKEFRIFWLWANKQIHKQICQ